VEALCDLENRLGALEAKIDALCVDLAELKGMVSQLPTVSTLAFVNLGLAVTVPGLVFAIGCDEVVVGFRKAPRPWLG
jgi:hypothetical protein